MRSSIKKGINEMRGKILEGDWDGLLEKKGKRKGSKKEYFTSYNPLLST